MPAMVGNPTISARPNCPICGPFTISTTAVLELVPEKGGEMVATIDTGPIQLAVNAHMAQHRAP